ncbi:MAG: TonB-dependent receptor [Bacteroidales bacterium]
MIALLILTSAQVEAKATIYGKVLSADKHPIEFATVHLKKSKLYTTTNNKGEYQLEIPEGNHHLQFALLGYETKEVEVKLGQGESMLKNVELLSSSVELENVIVLAKGQVSRIKESAYNAIAIETKSLQNSTLDLASALEQAPGMKLRESGGVGSDMQLMMDGFSGKHIKLFIDGVPQEGVGSSFSLNNIPINYAERIEIYKGVVPVGFGTDAIGGVINIVTKKSQNAWFLDASYSYGSFNTHKSYINFGQTLTNGLSYELNIFQNYSNNNYFIETPVKNFETGAINRNKLERVQRFNDTYHNEVAIAKIGIVNKPWANRLMFGFTYSQMYKDLQNGVRQEIVYGDKHRYGHSLMPSVEYRKRNLFIEGLEVMLTGNYNQNNTTNVDTGSYEYNWYGEKRLLRTAGEQSLQHTKSYNNNWNGTFTANYNLGTAHLFTLNHVLNSFERNNTSLLNQNTAKNAIAKESMKNISGLSYRFMPSEKWNMSAFAKYYHQKIAGALALNSAQDEFMRATSSLGSIGYGAATTYFIIPSTQAKLSYEKAYRLPTIEEMFGDEDLESGDLSIRPESSNNLNFSLTYNERFGTHTIYSELALIHRNTNDYIQRNITDLSGGKFGASYINHGKVLTNGFNISARYGFSKWLSMGVHFTQMNVIDNVKTIAGSSQESLTYKSRMPNLPYRFANSDASFFWHDLFKKRNLFSFTYDHLYMHSFPLYSEALGSESKFVVPKQFSHNISMSYSLHNGRYNLSVECRNLTDAKLYDNFSLQKAGRAFYAKIRISLGA